MNGVAKLYPLFFLFLLSCGYKAQLNKGKLLSVKDVEEVPFQFRDNFIYVEVKINGKDKLFILDSGAPNVIDKSIQEELGFKKVYDTEFQDAASRSRKLEMVKIDHIKFGDIEIKNSVAAVADFSKFTCLDIDGIIGTNIMSLFDWKIDYVNEVAQLYRNGIPMDSLKEFSAPIPLRMNVQKSPFIKMQVGNTTFNSVDIDLGSNGGIGVQRWDQFNLNNYPDNNWVYGETSMGIHGPITDTTRIVPMDNITLGNYSIPKTRMTIKPTSTSKIGNRFLKNYELILSWKKEAMYLKNVSEPDTTWNKNVVYLGWKNNEIYIKGYSKDSKIQDHGIAIGDKVIRVFNLAIDELDESNFCFLKSVWKGQVLLQVDKTETCECVELIVEEIR